MSFVSTNSQIKNNILNYIRHLVSKTLYRAIEILFKPCCDVSIINAEAVCLPLYGTYEVTLTLSRPLGLLGHGLIFPFINGNVAPIEGLVPYAEGTIIKFTTKELPEIVGNLESIFAIALLPSSLGIVTFPQDLTPFVGQLLPFEGDVFFEDCWA